MCQHALENAGHCIRWQDSAFCTILWNILVLESLGTGQGIVLVEQSSLVHRIVPLISCQRWILCIYSSFDSLHTLGPNDTNATASDIPEPEVESAEFRANDHKDSKGLVWVLDTGQEGSIETEGDGNFGRLIEVGLEDVSKRNYIYNLALTER